MVNGKQLPNVTKDKTFRSAMIAKVLKRFGTSKKMQNVKYAETKKIGKGRQPA